MYNVRAEGVFINGCGDIIETIRLPVRFPAIRRGGLPPHNETAPFFLHDVGVVILKSPGVVLTQSQYSVLPSVNQFDALKTQRGLRDVTFTAVVTVCRRVFRIRHRS